MAKTVEGLSVNDSVADVLDVAPSGERTLAELLERIRNREPIDLGIPSADLIREGREEQR